MDRSSIFGETKCLPSDTLLCLGDLIGRGGERGELGRAKVLPVDNGVGGGVRGGVTSPGSRPSDLSSISSFLLLEQKKAS
mmetsp:Transcript_27843/g.56307  ORF Transcript_27843/g.56307 Transcript_27843/m.56307 type:complete len:80 (+) Transcript_27843:236-475(+)